MLLLEQNWVYVRSNLEVFVFLAVALSKPFTHMTQVQDPCEIIIMSKVLLCYYVIEKRWESVDSLSWMLEEEPRVLR